MWAQNFDGDVAILFGVVREVYRGHSARTEFALDAVPVSERCLEAGEDGIHPGKLPISR